jgi:hypothetical protein
VCQGARIPLGTVNQPVATAAQGGIDAKNLFVTAIWRGYRWAFKDRSCRAARTAQPFLHGLELLRCDSHPVRMPTQPPALKQKASHYPAQGLTNGGQASAGTTSCRPHLRKRVWDVKVCPCRFKHAVLLRERDKLRGRKPGRYWQERRRDWWLCCQQPCSRSGCSGWGWIAKQSQLNWCPN